MEHYRNICLLLVASVVAIVAADPVHENTFCEFHVLVYECTVYVYVCVSNRVVNTWGDILRCQTSS